MSVVGPALTLSNRLGSYELIRPIAQGGMADVYLARRVGPGRFERHVAVKVLNRTRAADAEACAMFLDEARLVALLNHHNIASVHEVDVVDGKHYLAMEYVHGADLRDVLSASQRAGALLPYETSISIVCAAAAGLDHAHRRCGPDGKPLRLVHRDVSLSNIMVGHDGSVKVVDFGIATTTIASVHTLPGVVRGKASYMSPEQCLGDPIDHRSDVFALGVVLYELTTGARCFAGKTDFERMVAVVRGEYIAPGDLVADYPPELEQVIRTALSTSPDRRYGSAAAMAEALERVAIGRGWVGGPSAIGRAMRGLFGDVAEPWTSYGDDAPVTEPHSIVSLPMIAEPTRPGRRLARGTASDCFADELDERTRGRGPVRRTTRPWLAA
ncbi:MAG TPA: serine/threonine-protein kinase [Kofleriaceae bacterium]|nr:serine/threonine-protein kinase [Kofleriaceae bacterium]HMG55998.1 serine/threonine-protein kinase [Kofleriaceae bacterium]